MRFFAPLLLALSLALPAYAQEDATETQATPTDQTAEKLAGLQSQVDALAQLPADEAQARRDRANAFTEVVGQLADIQSALAYGQSDVTASIEDVQDQLTELAGAGDLGETPEETRWIRASVTAMDRALDDVGREDLFSARNQLTRAALHLAQARAIALGG